MMPNDTYEGIKKLKEAYEDGLFRLVMNEVAEEEGKLLLEENKDLKRTAENHPSQKEIDRFKKLLNKHLKRAKKKPTRTLTILRRTFASVAAVVIIFSTMMLTVQAFRVQVLNFLINIRPEYTSLELNSNKNVQAVGKLAVNWSNSYMPSYIPEGFVIKNVTYSESIKRIMFSNQNTNSTIIYTDYSSSTSVAIDTEGASLIKSIKVNGQAGTLSIKGSVTSVAWSIDDRIFTIQGQISSQEATKMAEGVKYYS